MLNKTGISLVSMKTALEVESFFETYYKETGQYPSLEIPYEWDSLMLEYLPSIKGRVLSGHNPCPGDGDFLPNLGSRDSSVIRASLDSIVTSAETVVSFGGDILILHAGYLQDGPLITHNIVQNRKKGMCKPGYEESADYSLHMKAAIGNLNEAAAACMDMGVRLAVENLLPRFNYLFQMPEDFLFMVQEIENIFICVDVGHLWVSSLVHDYDYLQALILLISTERVVSAHIHDNRSINGNNPHYNDDHGTIGTGFVPIKESISLLVEKSSANLIIESISDPVKNLKILNEMMVHQGDSYNE